MKTVSIVGAHPRTRDQFDFERADCDIWVFNEAMSAPWCKRATAVFQMHSPTIWRNPANRNDPGHYAWLQSGQTPEIYMQEKYSDVPGSIAYPLSDIVRHVLGIEKPLAELSAEERANTGVCFTSTLAYMLALAIYQGYTRIEIYGCELETGTEYQFQRESFAHWAGLARGRGIVVDDRSNILRDLLYGYEGAVAVDYEVFEQRMAELGPERDALKEKFDNLHTVVQSEFNRYASTGKKPEQFFASVCDLLKLAEKASMVNGQWDENRRYKEKADAMRATTGEHVFSRQEFEGAIQSYQKAHGDAVTKNNVTSGKCGAAWAEAQRANSFRNRGRAMAELGRVFEENLKATVDAYFYAGATQENMMFMQALDKKVQAAGGAKSEAVMLERLREVVA